MSLARELHSTPAAPANGGAASATAPITVVMVTYASSRVVGKSLVPLKRAQEEGLIRCVVVDNDSPDDTADVVERDHPWVELVRSPGNLGYGRGCNLGFERVRTPYVLFMNADVVIGPEAIRELLSFHRSNDRIGMSAPATTFSEDDLVQHVGNAPTPWSLVAAATGLPGLGPKHQWVPPGAPAVKTDWLCGAILLLKSEVFRSVGGFDPRFFLYFEETDLCRRLRAAGWELWAVGSASAKHLGGASARHLESTLEIGGCLSDHFYRSRYYFVSKHFGRLAAALSETGELVAKGSRDLLRALLLRPSRHELRNRMKAPVFSRPDRNA